jgi:hypothetical protein
MAPLSMTFGHSAGLADVAIVCTTDGKAHLITTGADTLIMARPLDASSKTPVNTSVETEVRCSSPNPGGSAVSSQTSCCGRDISLSTQLTERAISVDLLLHLRLCTRGVALPPPHHLTPRLTTRPTYGRWMAAR